MSSEGHIHLRTPDGQLELLRDFTTALASAGDMADVLQTLANCAGTVLDWNDCVIYLVDEPGELIQRAAYGPKSPDGVHIADPIRLSFGMGIVGAAAELGESQRVADTRLDERYVLDDEERLSELAVPIICDGEVVGVIDSEHADVGFFTADDQKLMEKVSRVAAQRVKVALTIEQTKRDNDVMQRLAKSDSLTGLGNRQLFEYMLQYASAAEELIHVAVLDLDRFKYINDRLGHRIGDRLLNQFANILRTRLQTDSTTICRLNGDEFGVIERGCSLEHFTSQLQVVQQDLTSISWSANNSSVAISAAIGLASGLGREVWKSADDALLVAKADGPGTLLRFDEESHKAALLREDRRWVERLTSAIENDQLFLMGQPIMALSGVDSCPAYHEMLLRYRDENGEIHTPDKFLDSAARFGMLQRIDGWVIWTTIDWLAKNPGQVASLNVTPGSLISGFALDRTRQALVDLHVDASRVVLEVTEHAAIGDPHAFRRSVEAARDQGVRIAVDDLGSGWSSLAVIRDAPVAIIKIDGQWVRQAVEDPVARCAVRSMVDCAHLLEATVVAEWIEDDQTLQLMSDMGVEHGQGWLFSGARALDAISADTARDVTA